MNSPINIISFVIVVFKINAVVSLSNSLDVDFYSVNGFDAARCGLKTEWERVNYDSIGVDKPSNTSATGLRAAKESCLSSFPLYLVPNSTLDVSVLVKTRGCVMEIEVRDELISEIIKKYKYDESAKEFQLGWKRISITIDIEVSGYINLLGFCEESNGIIVDSLLYTPSTVPSNNKKANSNSAPTSHITISAVDNDDFIIEDNDIYDDDDEGSGSGDGEPTELPTEAPIIEPEPGVWTPLTISLTAIGSAGGLAAVAGIAYFVGKTVAVPSIPLQTVILGDEIPPRLIPRVRSVNTNSNYNRFR